jgi:hypothetical protein
MLFEAEEVITLRNIDRAKLASPLLNILEDVVMDRLQIWPGVPDRECHEGS